MNLRTLTRLFARSEKPEPIGGVTATVQSAHPLGFVCSTDIEVACVSGTAWITTEADTRDVVLEAGQVHIASSGNRLFINAMPVCELRMIGIGSFKSGGPVPRADDDPHVDGQKRAARALAHRD